MPEPSLVIGPQRIGTDRTYTIGPLKDGGGVDLVDSVTLTGSEPVVFTVWQGEDGDELFAPIGAVADEGLGTLSLTISVSDTETLPGPGRFRIAGTIEIDGLVLDVLPSDAAIDFADSPGLPTPTTLMTRAKAERVLIRRCGRLLRWAKLDGSTFSGTNVDLADPIASAMRSCGVSPADPTDPADDDFDAVDADDYGRFFDVAELRCLESVWGNLDEVTEQEGTDKQDWNQAKAELRRRIDAKRQDLKDMYGFGYGDVVSGTLELSYTEPDPDDELGEDGDE